MDISMQSRGKLLFLLYNFTTVVAVRWNKHFFSSNGWKFFLIKKLPIYVQNEMDTYIFYVYYNSAGILYSFFASTMKNLYIGFWQFLNIWL